MAGRPGTPLAPGIPPSENQGREGPGDGPGRAAGGTPEADGALGEPGQRDESGVPSRWMPYLVPKPGVTGQPPEPVPCVGCAATVVQPSDPR